VVRILTGNPTKETGDLKQGRNTPSYEKHAEKRPAPYRSFVST